MIDMDGVRAVAEEVSNWGRWGPDDEPVDPTRPITWPRATRSFLASGVGTTRCMKT